MQALDGLLHRLMGIGDAGQVPLTHSTAQPVPHPRPPLFTGERGQVWHSMLTRERDQVIVPQDDGGRLGSLTGRDREHDPDRIHDTDHPNRPHVVRTKAADTDGDVAESPRARRAPAERAGEICCALVDVSAPATNGLATVRALRTVKPSLPCYLVTGSIMIDEAAFLASGAVGIIPRPIGADELHAVLARLCDLR